MDSSPPPPTSTVVYDSLHKAQKAAPQLKPIPSFEVYKIAREEELAAYRLLCRVLIMHHGPALPKAQQRILEDMGEELQLSTARQEMELELAAQDDVLRGIRTSQVLKRRGDFTDGVEDLSVEQYLVSAAAVDDGNTMYTAVPKVARVEGGDGVASNAAAAVATAAAATMAGRAAGSPMAAGGAKKKGQVQAAVSKLAKEIEVSGKALLLTHNAQEEQQLLQTLQQKREALVTLKAEYLEA